MVKIEIETMDITHLDDVYKIEEESFSIPWSRDSFTEEIFRTNAIYVVALIDKQVVGYGGMWHIINEGHITNIAVEEKSRKMGIGDAIIKKLEYIAKSLDMIGLTLEVRMNNAPAQRLYLRNGFEVEGIRKNYYSDTKEDALVMWKNFKK
ncbi:MAG: ribosomal protein S18-alanine N-acetyltransferase [Defluviitaleaceae bacterium]|nr:ribosomal protein S18-alanine N-acetyltransferase [Defluviitaleaceae bacterium]